MNKFAFTLFALLMLSVGARADYIDAVDKGNEALNTGDYKTALEQYHIAETDIPNSPELNYNMGLALYEQGSYDEATDRFTKATESESSGLASSAYYNLGNTKFKSQDYAGAIENYKKSLELNSEDMDAKYNLELARKMLKENAQKQPQDQQQQQQQQQEQKDQQQQQQDQKDQQQQQQQNQPQPDENGEDQQDQPQQQGQEGDQEQSQDSTSAQQMQPDDNKPMSKEDAERILNAFKNDEQEVQKKIKRAKSTSSYYGKDW